MTSDQASCTSGCCQSAVKNQFAKALIISFQLKTYNERCSCSTASCHFIKTLRDVITSWPDELRQLIEIFFSIFGHWAAVVERKPESCSDEITVFDQMTTYFYQ